MKKIVLGTILYIMKFAMNVIYFFIKLFPMKDDKITFLSRQSNYINIDFQLLISKLKETGENIDIKVLCKKIPQDFLGKIWYCIYIIKCMYHIATSKICVTDGYSIPISALRHKKGLIIIQIWHAMGAIKKFGKQALNTKEGSASLVANIMKMHKNYSYVMCTSEATKTFYQEAFQIDDSKILILGMPRIDYLLEEDSQLQSKVDQLLIKYPHLQEKKNILYVPTFRKGETIPTEELIKCIDESKYNFIIKLHPLDKTILPSKYTIDESVDTFSLLKIADYIITDYSAVAFEAAILKKPIFFYLYDIEKYADNRGLNIDIPKELPNETFSKATQLIKAIENNAYEENELRNFRNKYIETADTNNAQRIANFILKHLKK